MKKLSQIKQEVATSYGFLTFTDMIFHLRQDCEHNAPLDEVTIRYAEQLQTNTDIITTEICVLRERVAELEDGLKDCSWALQRVLDITKPDSDWATFTTSIVDIISLAESLINKGK